MTSTCNCADTLVISSNTATTTHYFAADTNITHNRLPQQQIAIMGLIGVGKTTLARHLSALLGGTLIEEKVEDHGLLEKFYANMKEYSFPLQMHLLKERYAQLNNAMVSQPEVLIQDRSNFEDIAFARLLQSQELMTEHDLHAYLQCEENTFKASTYAPMIVFLDAPPEVCLERIKKRNRPMENSITIDYLRGLSQEYKKLATFLTQDRNLLMVTSR